MKLFKVKVSGELVEIKSKDTNLDIIKVVLKRSKLQNLDIKYFISSYFNVNIEDISVKTIYETYHQQKTREFIH